MLLGVQLVLFGGDGYEGILFGEAADDAGGDFVMGTRICRLLRQYRFRIPVTSAKYSLK